MLETIFRFCQDSPLLAWLALAALALAVQFAIDARMGEVAEYFNAWGVVVAIRTWLGGGDPLAVHFLMGQGRLGSLALPIAIAVMFVQPLIYGGVVLLAVRFIAGFIT